MKTATKNRLPLLLALLGLTGLAIVFAPPPEESVVAVSPRVGARTAVPATPAFEEQVLQLRSRTSSAGRNLFEVSKPVVVAPPPMAAPAIAAAPPLPFRVLGTYQEGARMTVFLDDKGEGLAVRAGDTLRNDTYRIDAITEEKIEFTYLPLQQQQTLALGDAP